MLKVHCNILDLCCYWFKVWLMNTVLIANSIYSELELLY